MVDEPVSSRELEGDAVGRLLRLAGPRPVVSEERSLRVKQAAREVWRRAVVRERRRRRVLVLAPLLAAAALALLFLRPVQRTTPAAPAAVVAVVEVSRAPVTQTGTAEVHPVGAPLRAQQTIATPPGAGLSLRLMAGASLRIDERTRIRLVSGVELALERGAVYVDSGDAERGVRVVTPLGTVTDVGTQFETRILSDGVRVRVREGRVLVERQEGEQAATAGEQLMVEAGGEVHRASVPVSGPDWNWAVDLSPALDVDGQTLGAFLERLGSEMHWRFRFSPRSLEARAAGIVLHGSLAGLEPLEALEAALATCGLRAERRPDGFVIERSARPDAALAP